MVSNWSKLVDHLGQAKNQLPQSSWFDEQLVSKQPEPAKKQCSKEHLHVGFKTGSLNQKHSYYQLHYDNQCL